MNLPSLEAVRAHEAHGGLWRPIPRPVMVNGELRQPHTVALRLCVRGWQVHVGGGASLRDVVEDLENKVLHGAEWVPVEVTHGT